MWVRFVPIFEALREEIIQKQLIGDVRRFFMDFGNLMPLDELPAKSRLKDNALGAGALLDIGIYPLTFASLILGDFKVGEEHPKIEKVTSSLDIVDGMDEANLVVLDYAATSETQPGRKTAICTSTFRYRSAQDFARIEGSSGEITIFGPAGSVPMGFRMKSGPQPGFGEKDTRVERTYEVEKPAGALGFFWEADTVALDISSGRMENSTMPLAESLRMMKLMDEIRRQGGLVYPQDSVK
jgi:dihydrodiol dehydrogenase / D-xylose 1-dehydrogenase (NADP)